MHGVHVRWYLNVLLSAALQPEVLCGLVGMLLAEALVAGMAMPAAGHRPQPGPSPSAATANNSSPTAGPYMVGHPFTQVHIGACGTEHQSCRPAASNGCAVHAKVSHSAEKCIGGSCRYEVRT